MSKRLIITEKKSVADDFARVLGGSTRGIDKEVFAKQDLFYESDHTIIAWASGHLLELQQPGAYDKSWSFWRLDVLPIVPETFIHTPREDDRNEKLLKNLVKLINRPDVSEIVNGCDAGREGELIFNLILEHAIKSGKPKKTAGGEKVVRRLWLQSMTADSIRQSFRQLAPSAHYDSLRQAAYSRDEADWLVGMNGTRALTKRFLGGGKNRQSLAVGRVKTPTLAFLVDREREIDRFIPVPYFEIEGTFGLVSGSGSFLGKWNGKDADGKATDRIPDRAAADAIVERVNGKIGEAVDTTRRAKEKPPSLFDLTALQRRASSLYGFTLKRTLAIAQTLYEAKKCITYPRTSSNHLPNDYRGEVPKVFDRLAAQGYGRLVSLVPNRSNPDSERPGGVFDDAKVSDHFALIPTGEEPRSLREDEQKIYDMIVRRFLAAFMPSAERESITRTVTVEGETFKSTARKTVFAGWRAAEPASDDDEAFPPLADDGKVRCTQLEVEEKATTPPSRFSDGTLVGEMETCGKHVEDEDQAEALKEIGIGTPATRAAIVEDLIYKGLARRDGRMLVPTPLGTTLVRLVRNLKLEDLAKPDLTGEWEHRLRLITEGKYESTKFRKDIIRLVEGLVAAVKGADDVPGIFAVDHPKEGVECPRCGSKLIEKAYSYFCSRHPECETNIRKDIGGKHIFPEVLRRLLDAKGEPVGPFTGFERPKAPCLLTLKTTGEIEQKVVGQIPIDDLGPEPEVEQVPDGVVMGKCPKCQNDVRSEGAGYKCSTAPTCNFRLSKKLLGRELPPDEVKKMLSGPMVETGVLERFISRRGRPFSAMLYFDEKGALKWKFPPRPPKPPKPEGEKKATKKKASKKKTVKADS